MTSSSFLKDVENTRVRSISPLTAPWKVKEKFPISASVAQQILLFRQNIRQILKREDPRLLVIVGPCSIHDPRSALEYAARLVALAQELSDRLFIVMRVYFEKPRTVVGWKGLISDPELNDSGKMDEGIHLARSLLLKIGALGLPTATEFLDPIVPQYIADLVSWSAIGARTTESQTHREMASGLSMPVGFKNGTDGHIEAAINAMHSSSIPHCFLGIDQEGMTSIVSTTGNSDGHLVLRGGRQGVNYLPNQIADTTTQLKAAGLSTSIIVDCSHANGRNLIQQQLVWESILKQRHLGCQEIVGVMMESHLEGGHQRLTEDPSILRYGLSITDPCLDWETTERLLRQV
ncbi:MAG: 3-deoxy-7-phosphoheptulonate synthase [Chthoniobacterales bacterium]|nr:3-deoxy-7-phosphoheptulonate synthase [Chthoniobacterales bacterium]